jgi:hypothetical protein
MALGEFTKQIAQQALLSATAAPKETPQAQPANAAAAMTAEIAAMQKPLKEDEELVVTFQQAGERIRVVEIYIPSAQVVVLTGFDANRALTRVVSAPAALQLICKTSKTAPGAKPVRVALLTHKPKDSSA